MAEIEKMYENAGTEKKRMCEWTCKSYRQITVLKTYDDEYSSENADPIKAFLTCVLKCVSNDEDTADYIRETEWE